jgi:hypothetical protein
MRHLIHSLLLVVILVCGGTSGDAGESTTTPADDHRADGDQVMPAILRCRQGLLVIGCAGGVVGVDCRSARKTS